MTERTPATTPGLSQEQLARIGVMIEDTERNLIRTIQMKGPSFWLIVRH